MLALVLWVACTGGQDTAPECEPSHAVVTDIDETLTTADEELWAQVSDPTYDPRMRPDANTLFRGYADRGYAVVYITARGEDTSLSEGRTMRGITEGWLTAHGFPRGPVHLAPGVGVIGQSAIDYKAGVVDALQGEGITVAWGYGNAETDIQGFQAAGMPDATLYLVGELAGQLGVNGIPDADAYTAHLPVLDGVPLVDCAL